MEKELNNTFKKERTCKQCGKKCPDNDTDNDTDKNVSIQMLNDDCLIYIFQFLSILDRVRIERVCKRWRILSKRSFNLMRTLDLSSFTCGFTGIRTADFIFHKILRKYGRFVMRINLSRDQDNRLSQSIWTLGTVAKFCPKLKDLDITGIRCSTSNIQNLANKCKNIIKLKFGQRKTSKYYIYDEKLQDLFRANCNLKYLEIVENLCLNKCLLCLPTHSMHTLILWWCDIQNNHLLTALRRLENLRHLALKECLNIHTLDDVGKYCKNLTELEVTFLYVFREHPFTVDLFHLANLQVLKLYGNPNMSDQFLINLAQHCQQLIWLNIRGCSVSDTGLAALTTLLKLEILVIDHIHRITGDSLQNMSALRELYCRECVLLTDQNMSMFITSSPQLELLDISGCVLITKVTLQAAIYACKRRSNNVTLKIFVKDTRIKIGRGMRKGLPPLLRIVHKFLYQYNYYGSSDDEN